MGKHSYACQYEYSESVGIDQTYLVRVDVISPRSVHSSTRKTGWLFYPSWSDARLPWDSIEIVRTENSHSHRYRSNRSGKPTGLSVYTLLGMKGK
jgi:hypothetical protein